MQEVLVMDKQLSFQDHLLSTITKNCPRLTFV